LAGKQAQHVTITDYAGTGITTNQNDYLLGSITVG